MKRICLIGTSHLACWKEAWDELDASYSDQTSLTFFGANGARMFSRNAWGISERALVPRNDKVALSIGRTSKGLDRIEVEHYTHFVLVGFNFGFRNVLPIFLNYGLVRHAIARPNINLISSACLREAADSALLETPAMSMRKLLFNLTDKPIYIATHPCFDERVLRSQTLKSGIYYSALASALETDYLKDIYSYFEERARKVAADNRACLLMQNPSTMAYAGFTKSEFGQNGVSFNDYVHRDDDVSHKNKTYGEICLKQLFNSLDI